MYQVPFDEELMRNRVIPLRVLKSSIVQISLVLPLPLLLIQRMVPSYLLQGNTAFGAMEINSILILICFLGLGIVIE